MNDAIDLDPARPEPRPDEASAAFFEALRAQRLLVQRCGACGTSQLARGSCIACGARALEWREASGSGMLKSFAIVHANGNPHFNRGEPYNIAIVELAEGPQIYANIVNAGRDRLRIGMPLRVCWSSLASGAVAPVFEPASGTP